MKQLPIKVQSYLNRKPRKITEFLWKFQAILWILLVCSYGFIYQVLHKLPEGYEIDHYDESFWIFALIATLIIIGGHIRKVAYTKITAWGYFIAFVIALPVTYQIVSSMAIQAFIPKMQLILFLVMLAYIIFLCLCTIMGLGYYVIFQNVFHLSQFTSALILSFTMSFILFFYVPAQSFFGSFSDYAFPYQLLVKAYIVPFLIMGLLPPMIFAIMKNKVFDFIYTLGFGILLMFYFQYLFFNKNLGTLNGEIYDFRNNLPLTIIDTLLWIGIIIGLLILLRKKKELSAKLSRNLTILIAIIYLMTYIPVVAGAPERCFRYADVYFSYEDQYRVASEDNFLVFIIDAADNDFIDELSLQNPSVFDNYKDFTTYTNTCSVYDYTSMSLLQIMTNVPFDNTKNNLERREVAWALPQAVEFYDRFHNAGYKIQFFNFDNENTSGVLGKIDNAQPMNNDENGAHVEFISYKTLRHDMNAMIGYVLLPTILKGTIGIQNVSFDGIVITSSGNHYEENEEFAEHLNLSMSEDSKFLTYQHIFGCHAPGDNAETLGYCLDIVANYMDQMKELGVYDNANILIISDHGKHDPSDITGDDIFASSPIFMLKRAGETHDVMEYNAAPIYFTDILPTTLALAGLYDENNTSDFELFGPTIDAFHEGDLRERVWYDRVNDEKYSRVGGYNTYYGYTYTGDYEELKRVVENGENLVIYPVPKQND